MNIFADALIERAHRTLNLESAKPENLQSLDNWVNGTGCLARTETAYIKHHSDLFNFASSGDQSITHLDAYLGDPLVRLYRWHRKVDNSDLIAGIN